MTQPPRPGNRRAAPDPVAILLALGLGAAGGAVALWLALPLGMLLGSLVAVGAVAASGLRPLGRVPQIPQRLRDWLIPIIGVAIGGSFTPQILREMPAWTGSLLALAIYLPAAHAIGYLIYRRLGAIDRPTAYFGSVPGGLIECLVLGEEAGADLRMLTLLQFLRLILCIATVPLVFTLLTGHAVGSAAGAGLRAAAAPLGLADALVLLAAGVAGVLLGRLVRLPGAQITGPVILSGAAHLAGLTTAVPPGWMVLVTQWIVGVSLGARFAGAGRARLLSALRLAALVTLAVLALAAGLAFALSDVVGQPEAAVFLAYAPGGVAEMGLIALSLQVSVVYVTAHHVVRILLTVMLARLFARAVLSRGP